MIISPTVTDELPNPAHLTYDKRLILDVQSIKLCSSASSNICFKTGDEF